MLQVTNDIFFVTAGIFAAYDPDNTPDGGGLDRGEMMSIDDTTDANLVQSSLHVLRHAPVCGRVRTFAQALATYDWRASSAPGLSESEETLRQGFRGSGGYRSLREDVLKHLSHGHGWVANVASEVRSRLGLVTDVADQ